jgi:DNA-directed RNA polymerase II subunit RPB1
MKRIHTNEYKNPSKIIGIQFSMLSPEEIRKNSVVEITSKETTGKLSVGGLFDTKMGVLERGMFCPTDGLTCIDTPGYFGHMEMAMPIFFIQHFKEVVKVCKITCYRCSKLLINKKKYSYLLDMTAEERWNFVTHQSYSRCGEDTEDGCGCKQPTKWKVEGFASLHAVWENMKVEGAEMPQTIVQKMSPEKIYKMFRRISDEDVQFMGMSPVWSRPEWMICKVLPVPPPAVRPSVKHDAQQRSEDDLTHIYMNILKTNNMLKEKIAGNANPSIIDKYHQILQYYVAMIANNKASGASPIGQPSGRPLQCISGRLNTKTGRLRGNLMGKRVDFSARSVITGDPNLSIRQLGVPMKIAKNITKPVTVNDRNREFLTKLVQNGPDVYPGAKLIERNNGHSIHLRYVDRTSLRLENGDKVHRHMMDGDYVLFNRQPSLHKMSMMCHEVKVMPKGDTFRFNVAVTAPYNADFDGDEMNMHMPQSIPAEVELMHLPAVTHQIISPSKNAPIIGIFQDSLLGCNRFTRNTVTMSAKHAMNLLMMCRDVDVDTLRAKKANISSFDILSNIFPTLSLRNKNKMFDSTTENAESSNNIVEIKNGQYIRGQIDKSIMGAGTKGILHRVCNDFNNPICVRFIDDLQNVITEYMKTSSFSVGISDLIADQNTKQRILHKVAKRKEEVQDLINKMHMGIYENNSAFSNAVDFEMKITNILNQAAGESGSEGRKSLSEHNRFLKIVNSGSKGSVLNISQMMSCLGQQSVEGKRVPYGFESRTLPHFSKYDDSPTARGFIENSYINGLSAHEMFFHAMAGRIGLIDTAVKTSQTGYAQRRIIKSLEDITVTYDMTVRNHMGKIIQFSYGDDGFDSTKVESQLLPLVHMSLEEIYMHYDIVGIQNANVARTELLNIFTKPVVTRISKQRKATRERTSLYVKNAIESREEVMKNVFGYKEDINVVLPVSFQNAINNIKGQLQLDNYSMVDITPLEVYDMIEANYEKMMEYSQHTKPNALFKVLYDYYLCPKELLFVKRFNRAAVLLLLDTVYLKYKQAIVHPGEMVGIVAAQSVGEPTTQLTLNTFHNVGVASKSNVTRGVPRIEEILRLTKNPKTSSLSVPLKAVDMENKDRAMQYANMIEHTKLADLVKAIQIYYDPDDARSVIDEDQPMIDQYYEFERLVKECTDFEEDTVSKSKWVIRMEMDADTLLHKNISMDDIHFAIQSVYSEKILCIYSDYNDSKLIFRIRTLKLDKKDKAASSNLDASDEIYLLKNFQEAMLKKIILRGVEGISKAIPFKQSRMVKEDGKYVKKDTWLLDTAGSNLLEVLGLPFIDVENTYSNDIYEIYQVLGLEAARQAIMIELMEVMSPNDVYINYHHLSVLCDRMTYAKDMVAVYRSGILKDDLGPVAKATFEVHTEMLLQSARHANLDNMRGVSANVMCGQFGYFGTGAFNVMLDLEAMEKSNLNAAMAKHTDIHDEAESIVMGHHEPVDDKCSLDKITVKNYLSAPDASRVTGEAICQDDDYDMGF